MTSKRLLFISGSGGLGHVTRDLAMAKALRQAMPGVEIGWLAASPASELLKEAREHLLPEAAGWADETAAGAELASRDAACSSTYCTGSGPSSGSIAGMWGSFAR